MPNVNPISAPESGSDTKNELTAEEQEKQDAIRKALEKKFTDKYQNFSRFLDTTQDSTPEIKELKDHFKKVKDSIEKKYHQATTAGKLSLIYLYLLFLKKQAHKENNMPAFDFLVTMQNAFSDSNETHQDIERDIDVQLFLNRPPEDKLPFSFFKFSTEKNKTEIEAPESPQKPNNLTTTTGDLDRQDSPNIDGPIGNLEEPYGDIINKIINKVYILIHSQLEKYPYLNSAWERIDYIRQSNRKTPDKSDLTSLLKQLHLEKNEADNIVKETFLLNIMLNKKIRACQKLIKAIDLVLSDDFLSNELKLNKDQLKEFRTLETEAIKELKVEEASSMSNEKKLEHIEATLTFL